VTQFVSEKRGAALISGETDARAIRSGVEGANSVRGQGRADRMGQPFGCRSGELFRPQLLATVIVVYTSIVMK
jgi:hypothetical protein